MRTTFPKHNKSKGCIQEPEYKLDLISTIIVAEDMNEEMQEMAIGAATAAFQKTFVNGNVYAQIAAHIRQDFDERDGKGWNCVVGRSFGAFVTHKIKTYIYFSVRISKYLLFFFVKLHNIRSHNIATTGFG